MAEKSRIRIVLIGSGNVSWHLGFAFRNAGLEIVQLRNRSSDSGQALANDLGTIFISDFQKELPTCEFVVVAVRDSILATVLNSIRCAGAVVLHTSGTQGLDIFPEHLKKCGILYPLQTLTKGVQVDLRRSPLLIEASDEKTVSQVKDLAGRISEIVHVMSTEQRRVLHISGIFINNFTNHMVARAFDFLDSNKLDRSLLLPLFEETINKLELVSPYEAQTGPARRNDLETIRRHIEILSGNPQMKKLYRLMTDSIIAYYSKLDKSI